MISICNWLFWMVYLVTWLAYWLAFWLITCVSVWLQVTCQYLELALDMANISTITKYHYTILRIRCRPRREKTVSKRLCLSVPVCPRVLSRNNVKPIMSLLRDLLQTRRNSQNFLRRWKSYRLIRQRREDLVVSLREPSKFLTFFAKSATFQASKCWSWLPINHWLIGWLINILI